MRKQSVLRLTLLVLGGTLSVGAFAQDLSKPVYTKIGNDQVVVEPLRDDILAEHDVRFVDDDGVEISMNVYRPKAEGKVPVIIAFTSYDKDMMPEHYVWAGRADGFRKMGQDFGNMRISTETSYEAPDPNFWVPNGYAVVVVDARGTGFSGGEYNPFGPKTVASFVRAVEWAADQSWSTGKVGSQGVSYLGIIQWYVAAQRPRGLAAVNVWEGMTDILRDGIFHGGIAETAFIPWWLGGHEESEETEPGPHFGLTDLPRLPVYSTATEHTINDTEVEQINVPVLVTGSWSMQGLHSRGSFEGYKRLTGDKYLYTHGGAEWTTSNSDEAHAYQKAFFDHYLKGDEAARDRLMKVRLEVRSSDEEFTVREAEDWPVQGTTQRALYLNGFNGAMEEEQPAVNTMTQHSSVDPRKESVFSHTFDRATEVVGNAKLKVWLSTSAGNDMDVFVGLRKVAADGSIVNFWNRNGRQRIFSHGWMRVSLRKLDPERSTDAQPIQAFDEYQPIEPGQIVPVEIEILPMAVMFEAGSTLELVLKGSDIVPSPGFAHHLLVNQGNHNVFAGGDYDSYLLLPIIE